MNGPELQLNNKTTQFSESLYTRYKIKVSNSETGGIEERVWKLK